MPRFNSQTLIAAKSRAFVRARVPGAERAGSASLPLSDSAAALWLWSPFAPSRALSGRFGWLANVAGRIGRGNIGVRIHGSDQSAGRAVKVVTVRRSVTAAASNRVRDFIWGRTMVEARYSVKNGFTRPARESGSRSPATLPFLRSKANYPRSSSIHISRPAAFALQACRNLRQINFHREVVGAPAGLGRRA